MNKRTKRNNKCISLVLIFSMLLSVICVFPSFAEGEVTGRMLVSGTSFSDGVYVFNNRLTGKYLGSTNGTSFTMRSGKMANICSTVQFSIRYVAGGCYDIRLTSNSKYLTRSSTTSNKNVILQSSLDLNYSLWKIETYTYNGYTYHYFYNAETYEYLTWQNGTLQVVSTLAYPGTEAFYASSWRVANPSSGVFRELTSVTIDDMWLPCRLWEAPTVHAYPSDADMCAPFDFTYTFDTAYVEADTLTGCIRPIYAYGCCTKTITATHKPTGIQTTFSLTMNPKGSMLGVYSNKDLQDGHDHTSALRTVIQQLSNSGYFGGYLAEGDGFTVDEVDDFLDDNKNSIFVSRSHGTLVVWPDTGVLEGTCIVIQSETEERRRVTYQSNAMSASLDLSNMRIVAFVGCYTGASGSVGKNLPSVAVARGAKVAIGFETTIQCDMANEWTERFFAKLANGSTVSDAVEQLNLEWDEDGECFSIMQPYVAGDGTVTLC